MGLSLSLYGWKALTEQNINMGKYFNNTLVSLNPNRIKNMHFCPKRPGLSKLPQMKVLFLPVEAV